MRSRISRGEPRQGGDDGVEDVDVRGIHLGQGVAQQVDSVLVLREQGLAGQGVADGGELEDHREVVGQLLLPRSYPASR